MNRVARSKWLWLALLSLLLLTAMPLAAQGPSPEKDDGAHKIAPDVRDALAKTGQVEVLVLLTEQPDLSGADALPDRAHKARFVYERLRETATRSQPAVVAHIERQGATARRFGLLNALLVTSDAKLIDSLARRPDVARLEPNKAVKGVQSAPDAPATQGGPGTPWGITRVKAPDVWTQYTRGQGIVVAVADTGVEWTHPALQPKYRGWNGGTADHTYNWHDAIVGETTPVDDNGHGTHVTGTVLGDEAANHIGVAPEARWIGCRNMDRGVGTPARYLDCMEFFLAPFPPGGVFLSDGRPDLGADVINNSWSCPVDEGCYPHTLTRGVAALRAAGIAFVGSAGNNGSACNTVNEPPSITDETFSVGAYDTSGAIASFSSRGLVTVDGSNRPKPDLAAPGVGVISARRGGGYSSLSGTSMASPHVAGVVALLWAAVPALNGHIEATEAILRQTATQRDDSQCGMVADGRANNVWGWGEVNALAAIELARTTGQITGRVQNGLGFPISGAQVTLTGPGAFNQTLSVDAGGQFAARLAPGVYTLTASAFGYQSNTVNVTLDPNGAPTRTFTLTPEANLVLTGIVRQAGLSTPVRATVEVVGANRRAATDAYGHYALSLPPGSYTLRTSALGYRPSEQSITLSETQTRDFNLLLAPNILLVDDDEGQSFENTYKSTLNSLGRSYDIYEVRQTGLGPPAALLEQYCLVIWIVGGPLHRLRAADTAALKTYLDHGGRLLLSEPGGAGSTFHREYLRVAPTDSPTASTLVGLGAFEGQTLSYSNVAQTDAGGAIAVTGDGQAIYGWQGQAGAAGVAYRGTYRSIYLSFGLQNIAQSGRQVFLAGLLDWLGCPLCRLPADVDYSGRVDVLDIALVTTAWGATSGTPRYQMRLDRNLDGLIDGVDVDVITKNWLVSCP